MPAVRLTRRSSLLLPFLLAACGDDTPRNFPPLRYDYLKPIDLAVKTVDIELRTGGSDLGREAPANPLEVLRQMGEDRLKALGNAGRAVFSISEASLTRDDDSVVGVLNAKLEIFGDDGQRAGFAQAQVTRTHTGRISDKQQLLYDMVSGMMNDMNVELEHQIRTQLKQWLAESAPPAVPDAVESTPLTPPPGR